MSKSFIITMLIVAAMIPASCSTAGQLRKVNAGELGAGVIMQHGELARMETAVKRDTAENRSDVMNAVPDENGEMTPIDVLETAYVFAKHKQVSERRGQVELDFEIVVPGLMFNPSWQIRITPVLTILGEQELLDSLLITGEMYKEAQLRGYEKYERYIKSLLPLDEEDLFLYKRDLRIFLERFALSPFGVSEEEAVKHYTKQWLKRLNLIRHSRKDKKYERFVKSPFITGGVRIDTIMNKAENSITYRYRQTVNTIPRMKRIDLNLRSAIMADGERIYSRTGDDTVRFYISSISSLADNREKYIKMISKRDSIINAEANIRFELDKSYFKDSIADNKREFGRITGILEEIFENDGLILDSIIILGAASPEGDCEYNLKLSSERAAYILNKIRKFIKEHRDNDRHILFTSFAGNSSLPDTTDTYSLVHTVVPFDYDKLQKNISACGIGEDWDGMERLLVSTTAFTDMQKREILACMSLNEAEERERRLKSLPYYETISDSLFNRMRNVKFTFHLHKKDAINDTITTTVIDTTYMNGLHYLRERDYKKALDCLKYYDDYNTALTYLLMDYNRSALNILKKLKKDAERDYLLAISYSRLGDTEKAREFLGSAIKQDEKFKYRYKLDPECSVLME